MTSRGWDLFYYIFWGFLGVVFAQELRLWWQQLMVVFTVAILVIPYRLVADCRLDYYNGEDNE